MATTVVAVECGRGVHRSAARPRDSAVAAAPRPPRVPPDAAPWVSPRAWRDTASIVRSPALRAKVDALAAADAVESAAVGASGSPSRVWAAYEAVVAGASRAEMLGLLEHRSPVVRAYASSWVVEHAPGDAARALAPLLADATPVDTLSGCIGEHQTVAALVAGDVCAGASRNAALAALGAHSAGDTGVTLGARAALFRCGALVATPGFLDAVRALLDAPTVPDAAEDDPSQYVRVNAIDVLGAVHDPADLARLLRLRTDPASRVRAAVAASLSAYPFAATRAALEALARDPDWYVRENAARVYLAHPEADGALAEALLLDETPRVVDAAAQGLASSGTNAALDRVESLISQGRASMALSVIAAREPRDQAPRMRRLLASPDFSVRVAAIGYLGEVRDASSAAALRPFLADHSIHEQMATARALAAIGDRGALPALARLLDDGNPNARIAAAQAIVALRGREDDAALAAAVARDHTWGHAQLASLLGQLRAGEADAGYEPEVR